MQVISGKDGTATKFCPPPIHSHIPARQKDLPSLFTANTQKANARPIVSPRLHAGPQEHSH